MGDCGCTRAHGEQTKIANTKMKEKRPRGALALCPTLNCDINKTSGPVKSETGARENDEPGLKLQSCASRTRPAQWPPEPSRQASARRRRRDRGHRRVLVQSPAQCRGALRFRLIITIWHKRLVEIDCGCRIKEAPDIRIAINIRLLTQCTRQ